MIKIYHYPLCPLSRQLRVILKDIDIGFTLVKEEFWIRRKEFIQLSPHGELPILVDRSGIVVTNIFAIIEYLREVEPSFRFMSDIPSENAVIRRLFAWFNVKFYGEVTKIILDEKLIKFLRNGGSPNVELLKIAQTKLKLHFSYVSNLLQDNCYLAGDKITVADIAAACHISTIDYFHEIVWDYYPTIKDWYSLLKSRPSFRPLLQDYAPGFAPPQYYHVLDF